MFTNTLLFVFKIIIYSLFFTISVTSLSNCTTGDCIFNCDQDDCNEIVCLDSANSCTINCSPGNCVRSTFYLAASRNTVNCSVEDACRFGNFHCGIPPFQALQATEFTATQFDGHIEECKFIISNNAMSGQGLIECSHDIDLCMVETTIDGDFDKSTFLCDLTPLNAECIINCPTEESCGGGTSDFICSAANCQCSGEGCFELNIDTTLITAPPTSSTSTPTANPSVSPTHHSTIYTTETTMNLTSQQLFSSTNTDNIMIQRPKDSDSIYYVFMYVAIGIVICCCVPFCVVACCKWKYGDNDMMIEMSQKTPTSATTTSGSPTTSDYPFGLKDNPSLTMIETKKGMVSTDHSSCYSIDFYQMEVENEGIDTDIRDIKNFVNNIELTQYLNIFIKNGYIDLNMLQQIEDIEELKNIGIDNEQHQEIIMQEINMLKSMVIHSESVVTLQNEQNKNENMMQEGDVITVHDVKEIKNDGNMINEACNYDAVEQNV